VKIGGILVPMVHFDDNIVVFTTFEKDLQATLNVMNTTFKDYNLKINAAKTKTLVCYKKYILTINIAL